MNKQSQNAYTELLVVRSQLGEKNAMQLLVDLWHRPLVRFALRYLQNEDDARDAVQETWIAVIKGLNRLDSPSCFASWLFRILMNKCIDQIRQEKKTASLLTQVKDISQQRSAPDPSECLRRAVGKLSEEQRILITLRYEQGLKVNQIAAIMSMPEGTLKSRLHRVLKRLRAIMEKDS